MNEQLQLPVVHTDDTTLQVHSIFPTIQGEGPFAGRPAVFLRLHGCNLRCPGCDTDYTSKLLPMSLPKIHRRLSQLFEGWPDKLVVITGGEPFRQDIRRLCIELIEAGATVQIETNGTVEIDLEEVVKLTYKDDNPLDIFQVVCSPKTPTVSESTHKFATAWKYILSANAVDPDDGLPVKSLGMGGKPARPTPGTPHSNIYVQPMDVRTEQWNLLNTQAAVQSCMKYGYRLCLQTHKIVGLD